MLADVAVTLALEATADLDISLHQRACMMVVHMKEKSSAHIITPDDMRIQHSDETIAVAESISIRDFMAIDAPIDYNIAYRMLNWEGQAIHGEHRAAFLKAWAKLKYEFADAMLAAKREKS